MSGPKPAATPAPRSVYDVLRDIKKCVVFLGRLDTDGRPHWNATGFLVNVSGMFCLVTAKHVVADLMTETLHDSDLRAWYNLKPGGAYPRSIAEIKKGGFEWLFHENREVDLAVIAFPIIPAADDILTVPETMFGTTSDLVETLELVYFAFQPGVENPQEVAPIARQGMISRINSDGTFLIDGSAFPGNSGCPIFVKPLPARFLRTGVSIGDPLAFRMVGVVSGPLTFQKPVTRFADIEFAENTGLARAWSVDYLLEITRTDSFRKQVEKAKQSPGIPPS